MRERARSTPAPADKKSRDVQLADNRRASYDYSIEQRLEAISPWTHPGYTNHEPLRPRKLLLHKNEILFLANRSAQQGYTLVPLRMYTKAGRAKVELGLARGKRRYEKRQVIKEREAQREMDAAIRRRAPRSS